MTGRLFGRVDNVSPNFITGWAADLDRPTSAVSVCIFLNGRKFAEIPCDRARGDLEKHRVDGVVLGPNHGFRFEFGDKWPADHPVRVTVRHASNGRLLTAGDRMVPADGPVPPDLGADIDRIAMRMPGPTIPRQLFRVLRSHHASQGLYPLLARLDLDGWTPAALRYAVFGDMAVDLPADWQQPRPRDTLYQLLMSDVFREHSLRLFCDAFPEKQRQIFLHIPKCAGSDLTIHLIREFPSLAVSLRRPGGMPVADLFESIGRAARDVRHSDTILLHGHMRLSEIIRRRLLRPRDKIFTILREPVSSSISAVNYVLTRLREDVGLGTLRPDSVAWLRALGRPADTSALTIDDLPKLIPAIMANRDIVSPNPMCSWLGGGSAEEVIDRMASVHMEVTTLEHYSEWRRRRWGIGTETHANRSIRFLRADALSAAQLAELRDLTTEDAKLFAAISDRIRAGGDVRAQF
ncbi:MAG: hypothetical protein AB7O80_07620 [Acetobacteraceae bacterium]